jgi:hypothetical protein
MKDINYEKYRVRLDKLYPTLSEEEKREILRLRFEFWSLVSENFST